MTSQRIKEWRAQQGLSQLELAEMLRVSDPTLNRWEKGQEIPGPADLLLDWLIDGKVPFRDSAAAGKLLLPPEAVESTLNVQTTLRTWREIEARSEACGYADPVDWIASLIIESLKADLGEEIENKPSFIEKQLVYSVGNEGCAVPNLTAVSPATSTETAPNLPSRPALAANIVPLPETHWAPPAEQLHSGNASENLAAEGKPAETVESPRREVVYRKPRKLK